MTFSTILVKKLHQVSLFQSLGPAELEELSLMCTRLKLEAGIKIPVYKEDEGFYFYVVASGKVIAKNTKLPDDNDVAIEESGYFGEVVCLSSDVGFIDFYAHENTEILAFKQKDFLDILQNHPNIHTALSKEFCRRLLLTDSISSFTSISYRERLAKVLITLAKERGEKSGTGYILPKLSQEELRDLSDCSEDEIKETFLDLKDKGIIKPTESKQIFIASLYDLEKWGISNS